MSTFLVLIVGLGLLYLVAQELWEWRRDRRWQRLSMDFEKQAELRALKRATDVRRKKDVA